MNPTIKSQLHLGASMYVPTTRDSRNLVEIASGERYPELRSVIFCTEDAVRADELNGAMENLKQALRKFPERGDKGPMRFIRVRASPCSAAASVSRVSRRWTASCCPR